jgi:hypothetical protein
MGERRTEIFQTSFNGDYIEVEYFYPAYVSPSPPLIIIADVYPELVIEELRLSFASSWSDFSSAGNHIRAAVERLLDYLKEPRYRRKSGKQVRLTLHSRIKELANRNKELSDSLLAIKWLGNQGSHSDKLTRNDIFDALDILDFILNDLFICPQMKIKKLVTKINKAKGPVKKRSMVP